MKIETRAERAMRHVVEKRQAIWADTSSGLLVGLRSRQVARAEVRADHERRPEKPALPPTKRMLAELEQVKRRRERKANKAKAC